MNWLNNLSLFLSFALSFFANAQETDVIEPFQSFHKSTPFEKVYLHTDKEVYGAGESIWLAAYLVDGSFHLPSDLSQLVYVELLDSADQTLIQVPLKIVDGVANGDISLGDTLVTGKYTIRGFTNYQRNFDPEFIFSKPIFLVDSKPDSINIEEMSNESNFDFQIFPEGGDMIAEMVNHIGFKAVDSEGKGVFVEGELLDEDGAVLTTFKSQHAGLGKFLFTPEKWKSYQLKYTIEGLDFKMDVPATKEKGFVLSVRQTPSAIHVTGSASKGMKIEDSFILGHVRGQIFVLAKPAAGKTSVYAMIPHEKLPNGIVHFTLFSKGLPVQERLTYNQNNSILPDISIFPENLGTRRKVRIEVDAEDFEGEPINGKMSISILSQNVRENQITIASYLNLFSDLSGKVEQPSYYFDVDNKDRLKHLDLLMMTQGWRRFVWSDLLDDQLPLITYFVEKGFSIEGQVLKYYFRNKGKSAMVSLNVMENLLLSQEVQTKEDGAFWFEGLDIEDTVNLMIQTVNDKQRKKDLDQRKDKGTFIKMNARDPLPNNDKLVISLSSKSDEAYSKVLLEIDETYFKDAIRLDDFTVTAKKLDYNDLFERPSMIYKYPRRRLVADSVLAFSTDSNIFGALGNEMLGIRIVGIGQERTAVFQGSEVSFSYDGMPVDASFVHALAPQGVEFIDLIVGATAKAIYEGNHLAIYSKKGYYHGQEIDPKGMAFFTHNGYYQAREFYTPNHEEMSAEEALNLDIRSTQYWSSVVDIEDGEGSIEYFSSDNLGTFVLYLEGITDKGQPFAKTFKFDIDK